MKENFHKRWKNLIRIKQRRFWSVLLLLMAIAIMIFVNIFGEKRQKDTKTSVEIEAQSRTDSLYAGILAEIHENEMQILKENKDILTAAAEWAAERENHPENDVYTFLQGPKSWSEGRTWSGEWSNEYVKGNYFGNFGCGLCCMANIYCSLTEYTCSPWDMYEYARQVSGYSPTRKVGAIGWADMKVTLRKSGFECSLNNKPASYEEFQEQIKEAKGAVVLVCSRDDDTFWKKTGGHYVNICLYNEATDEVFLGDPGGSSRNREFIPLRYVYDALKTASQYQYLLVLDYAKEDNEWKHDGIDEAWVAPWDNTKSKI